MSVKITYFPHGTTTDNEINIATGRNQGKLSEKGKKQSKERFDTLKDKNINIVFCSDLKRAIDSANIGFGNKYKIIQDKRIRECNYGDFNGKEKSFKKDMKKNIYIPYKNGESYKDVEKRIENFLVYLKENYDGKNIIMISHEAPQLALEVILNNNTREQAIDKDRRKQKKRQPGWEYIIK